MVELGRIELPTSTMPFSRSLRRARGSDVGGVRQWNRYPLDVIVYATGFEAGTESTASRTAVQAVNRWAEKSTDGSTTFRGLLVSGSPSCSAPSARCGGELQRTYAAAGDYPITLEVEDDDGGLVERRTYWKPSPPRLPSPPRWRRLMRSLLVIRRRRSPKR